MNEAIFKKLKPWTVKSFELLFHAEIHNLKGTDYDKQLSLISFDNSIEVSITTYLTLNPIQRNNHSYKKADVEKWLNNYHTKLDFFFEEIALRKLPELIGKDEIVWFHDQRNEQYHSSNSGVPPIDTLNKIRQIAIWVFSVLFQISDIQILLNYALDESEKEFPKIPAELVKPIFDDISSEYEKPLFIASILGGWNEKYSGDNEIVGELTSGF